MSFKNGVSVKWESEIFRQVNKYIQYRAIL